jgi:hypothetical protein
MSKHHHHHDCKCHRREHDRCRPRENWAECLCGEGNEAFLVFLVLILLILGTIGGSFI